MTGVQTCALPILRGEVDVEAERVTQDAGALLPAPVGVTPGAGALLRPPVAVRRVWPWAVGATAVVAIVVGALAIRGGGDAAASEEVPPTPVREMGSDPISRTLIVDVRSNPAGAQILLDGRAVGVTPKRLDLPGPASLVVRRAGYRTANVRAERAGALDVKLVPLPKKPRESLD